MHVKPFSPPGTRASARFAGDEIRIDGVDKVCGQTRYAADVPAERALWAAFVESPYPHATIRAIDVSAARAIPGVHAVLTAADIGERRFGRRLCDWPILAESRVRFIGDRVAAVAAETPTAAEAAARAIVVEYDELPAVLDVAEALSADAPILHPEHDTYTYFGTREPRAPGMHPNVYGVETIERGEQPETIFATAAHIFTHTFTFGRQHAGYIEPRATLVWIDAAGIVHLSSPNKGPYAFRAHFAHAVGLPEEQIVLEPVAIGGDFGGKGLTVDELPCYFLARATGRPVRYTSTSSEELRRGPTRHAATLTLTTAIDATGLMLAHHSEVRYNGGAYAATKPIPNLLPGNAYGAIPYRVPNVRLDISGVYTNTLPAAHVRGPGELQTFSAWEVHVDRIARVTGIDPVDFRLRNLTRDGEQTLLGEVLHRPMSAKVLDVLMKAANAHKLGMDVGRGVSLTCAHTGSGKTYVRLHALSNGTVEARLGAVDQGNGLYTVVRRVVAETLGIAESAVRVSRANTSEIRFDQGSGHSRVTHIVGRAVLEAAQRLRAIVEEQRASSEQFVATLARLAADAPLITEGSFISDHGEQVPGDLTFGAYAIDVHVDRETGAVRIRNATFVMDAGQIINPVAHQGQIDGAFIFGLGAALMEDVTLADDGRVQTPSLGEYKLPTMRDLPPFKSIVLEAPDGDGPYGARMVGELANVGVAAAVINAIGDAAGVHLHHVPIRAEDVYAALIGELS
jgi:carbon-monoxide dehydrogenase large subunit